MRLVWVVIPLILIGIIGVQEGFSQYMSDFGFSTSYPDCKIPVTGKCIGLWGQYVDDHPCLSSGALTDDLRIDVECMQNYRDGKIYVPTGTSTEYTPPDNGMIMSLLLAGICGILFMIYIFELRKNRQQST